MQSNREVCQRAERGGQKKDIREQEPLRSTPQVGYVEAKEAAAGMTSTEELVCCHGSK